MSQKSENFPKIDFSIQFLPDQWPPTYLRTSITEHPKGAIIGICDIWDTDYNTDNW